MVALPFAAAATTTLRIGMLVLGNDYKHPAVVAKEAATLDVLSDGRLEFGLGAGWMTADYTALGLPYDRAGVRIARLGEALAVVKGAWGDGPFDFAGEHYTITAYDGLPKPRPAAAAADRGGRWWPQGVAARGTGGRHRRHQPDPARGGDRGGGGPRHARRLHPAQGRAGSAKGRGSASTSSSCRSATSWPRSPTTRRRWPTPWRPRSASTPSEALSSGGGAGGLGRPGVRRPRASAARSGACRTSCSATTTTRSSRRWWPASPGPEPERPESPLGRVAAALSSSPTRTWLSW